MKTLGKWAVVDEESMSTEPNAAILAIGATMIDDLEIVDRFYVNVDLQSCLAVGLHESQSTREWWAKQSAEAFQATQTDCVPIQTALQMWSDWINKHGKSVRLMGNGPCADNMWLNSAYKACGMKNPVPFWNDIDHRTLNWIGGQWLGVTKEDVPFKGVKHHAGDDAEHEAHHALLVLNAIQDALVQKELKQPTPEKGITIVNKQEFILNNITELVRTGRVEGLAKIATDLAEVYDISCDVLSMEELQTRVINLPVDPTVTSETLVHDSPITPSIVTAVPPVAEAPTAPVAEASTAPVAEAPTAPTKPGERTHDDWGLPFSEEWNASTRNTAGPGQFKRKAGVNEEEYAKYMQAQVLEAQAAGTFTGPDNWAKVSRLAKYLDPVQVAPTSPQVAQAETLQPQAETVGQALHAGAIPEAPTEPAPSVEAAPTAAVAAPTAPVAAPTGASEASQIPDANTMMQSLMKLFQGFGATDPRGKSVLEKFGVANVMQVPDNQKELFVTACNMVSDNLEVIKADASGQILKDLLDSVTL